MQLPWNAPPSNAPTSLTPDGIARRRRMAELLMTQGVDASPVQHWTQGAARLVQALAGSYQMAGADKADAGLKREADLKAATEKAKADAEKRNTPDWQMSDEGFYNVNPYMNPNGPQLVQKRPMSVYQREMMKAKRAGERARPRRIILQNKIQYYADTGEPVLKDVTPEAAGEPEFKENQTRNAGFSRRMIQGNDAVDKAMKEGADPTSRWGGLSSDKSSFNSAEWKRYEQGKRSFILAGLRDDTGASIGTREYEEMDTTFFPQTGDPPDVVEQKRLARVQFQRDLAVASGGAFEYMEKKNPRPPRLDGPTLTPEGANPYESLSDDELRKELGQ